MLQENPVPAKALDADLASPVASEQAVINFQCEVHPEFTQLLANLGISLLFTSYSSSVLGIIRTRDQELDVSLRHFYRPMGMAADAQRLTFGVQNQIFDYRVRKLSASSHEDYDAAVDAWYLPQSSHVTGSINCHDLAWGDDALWVVNTAFSCLVTIDSRYSFVPQWQPSFIQELQPKDTCHLNGMAMQHGKPKFVTSFCQSTEFEGWRDVSQTFKGCVIDVEQNRILRDDLCRPHSPRVYQDQLFVCESGTGLVLCLCPNTGKTLWSILVGGWVRGLAFHGPLLFVATSVMRQSFDPNKAGQAIDYQYPASQYPNSQHCSIHVYHIEQRTLLGSLYLHGDVEQIYDLVLLEHACPDVAQSHSDLVNQGFYFPAMPHTIGIHHA